MKTAKIALTAIVIFMIAACSTSKKTETSSSSSAPVSTTPFVLVKPANGIYVPGNEELKAIQTQYKDVTLDQLKEGHGLYTVGACINCHNAKSIYQFGEEQWKDIIENMAEKAKISDVQKDAVYKYVLAIKATQPKWIK